MAGAARRWPLSRRILGLALLNVTLIAAVLLVFAEWQFGLSLESLALGPARDRITAISESFARELDAAPYEARGDLLAQYASRYGAEFYLVDPRGQSLAGEPVELPAALVQKMRSGGPRGMGGPRAGRKGPPEEGGRGFDPEGRGGGRPGIGPPGLANERIFLTVTHSPLKYWVGVRMPTNGPEG